MRRRRASCRGYFGVRMGTVTESSKTGYRERAMAVYRFVANAKGTSSMKLHGNLWIAQKTAWFVVYRFRESRSSWPAGTG